jgi:ribonucleoside-diphosphate reductase alpha chain
MPRKRLPNTRSGVTHKITLGGITLYVTVNCDDIGKPLEMFVKADNGWQGWADALAVTASMAMQHSCPLETILAKWRGMRFEPDGIAGQGSSIPDAIARKVLKGEP